MSASGADSTEASGFASGLAFARETPLTAIPWALRASAKTVAALNAGSATYP